MLIGGTSEADFFWKRLGPLPVRLHISAGYPQGESFSQPPSPSAMLFTEILNFFEPLGYVHRRAKFAEKIFPCRFYSDPLRTTDLCERILKLCNVAAYFQQMQRVKSAAKSTMDFFPAAPELTA